MKLSYGSIISTGGTISIVAYFFWVLFFPLIIILSGSLKAQDTLSFSVYPSISLRSNSPIYAGDTLRLEVVGGNTFSWSGPLNFLSDLQNPIITGATHQNSGRYLCNITDSLHDTTILLALFIIVKPLQISTIQGEPIICQHSNLVLTGPESSNGFYYWSDDQNPSWHPNTQQVTINNITGPGSSAVYPASIIHHISLQYYLNGILQTEYFNAEVIYCCLDGPSILVHNKIASEVFVTDQLPTVILGCFTIDLPLYAFSLNPNIVMMPDSRIDIKNGKGVVFNDKVVYGCKNPWWGISIFEGNTTVCGHHSVFRDSQFGFYNIGNHNKLNFQSCSFVGNITSVLTI